MNRYIKIWKENTLKMNKALNEGNIALADRCKRAADSAYAIYRENLDEINEHYAKCSNFGIANFIFEEELPRLFKKNPKIVGKIVSTIKEDKNLSSQFRFYNALRKYNGEVDSREYIAESLKLAAKGINYDTVDRSNRKIANLFQKYGIDTDKVLSESEEKMYDNCNFILTNKKSLGNLNEINNAIVEVSKYVNDHKAELNESSKINVAKLVEQFNEKYENLLSESDQELVKAITDARAPYAQKKQKGLFDKFKKECIELVGKLLPEAKDDAKSDLEGIKKQLEDKEYNPDTVVTDVAHLLGIRDVLLDN